MHTRFILSVLLGFNLIFTPLAAATGAGGAKPAPATPAPAVAPNAAAKVTRPAAPASARRPQGARAAEPPQVSPGQTLTLLPDGRWLVTGGEGEKGPLASAVVWDARAKERTPRGGLGQARTRHTATLLPDGTILVYGGVGANKKVTGSAELFDPRTGQSEAIPGAGLSPRAEHTATLLTDGQVLVAGGVDENGRAVTKVELWDARTKSAATLPAGLKAGRRGHTATLTPDSNVLLWGGQGVEGDALNDGEIYEAERQGFSWAGVRPAGEDEGAPYVVFSSPKEGEASVPRDVRVTLRFSKPLRVETLNAETVTLIGPDGLVTAAVVPAEGGRLGFVTPAEQLQVGAAYTLSLNGAADDAGQPLSPLTLSFTTVKPEGQEHVPADGHDGHDGHANHSAGAGGHDGDEQDDESWRPDAKNPYRDWRANRGESPWQKLAPMQAEPGVTALAGQVLKLNGQPLRNVTIQIGDKATRTDSTGRFLLAGIPAGHRSMLVNGHTASNPARQYAMCANAVSVIGGKTNVLPYTIWLPVIDRKHVTPIPVPTSGEVVVTSPLIPGLEVRIPAGVRLRTHSGDYLTAMSLTAVPIDRTPVPPAPGARFFFTPQTHGAEVVGGDEGAGFRIIYPNVAGLAPGTSVRLMAYDAWRPGGWYVYGKGTVTKDGRQIAPDPGVVLKKLNCFGGFFDTDDGPDTGPAPGSNAKDGDPVDLGTGLFLYDKTDLALPDTIPVAISRTYRPEDTRIRSFGVGSTHPYNMTIVGIPGQTDPAYGELILPDGGRIRYERTNPGASPLTFEHTATPTAFYKSTMVNVNDRGAAGGFDIRLRDGTTLQFERYHYGVGNHYTDMYMVGIADRHGNALTIERDSNKRITRVVSPNGKWVEFGYPAGSSTHRIAEVRDNIGRRVGYEYDATGRLWKVTDVNGGVTEYTYDGAHRMLTVKDPRGIVFLTNEYDANGRVKKQTQADGTTYQFAYTLDAAGSVTQTDVTDTRGNVRRVTFNALGYALTDTYALGKPEQQTVAYERQPVTNKILKVTDPLGRKTAYAYDAAGNVTDVTSLAETASAATTHLTYDPRFNQLASVTDPLGHTGTFAYDDKGNLTSAANHLGHQTTFTYNAAGQMLTATDPLQHTATFVYDSGDLVEARDPLGRSVRRFVDPAGRMTSVTDPLGRRTRYEYDAFNQVKKVTDVLAGTTSFSYDPNGNLLSVTDARGKVTSYTYDEMDRAATRTDPLQGASSVVSYEYDEAGNLKKLTDRRGKVTTCTYDNLNRLKFVGFGTVVSGGVTSYESSISYTPDAYGRVTQAVDSLSGTITRSYDDLARTWSETTPQGTVGYSYDAAGRLTGKTVTGQAAISYAYDNADRLTGITQGASAVGFGYDDAGRRTSLTLPNGVVTEYGYDAASQPTSLTYRFGGITLGDLTYGYDASGRRTKVGGSFARTLLPQALASAAYDDANRLVQRGAAALTYDAAGNLTSDGVNTYTWDARGQLASISGGVAASFQYDAFGRRVAKTVGGQSTSYLYDGANVVQEQAGGVASANLLNGGIDEVFTRTDSLGSGGLLRGGAGSTLALTDGAGAVQTEYSYDPFGATTTSGAASGHSGQYTGRENDGTGLYYYRARYYSPALQRFISEDPIGLAGGINLYAYVGNDPVNRTDPSGLYWLEDVSNFSAGFGDTISLGGTAYIRGFTPGRKVVDPDSLAYLGGEVAGTALEMAMAAASGGATAGAKGAAKAGLKAKPPRARLKAKPAHGECFVAGTKVQTAGGEKRIEEVRAGDVVLSLNPEQGGAASLQRQEVTATFTRTVPVVLDVRVGGETITATPEHPFWVVGRGWTPAGALLPGFELLTKGGRTARVESVVRREGRFKVYNFEVAGTHTYFVSPLGVLVHNQCHTPDQQALKDLVEEATNGGRKPLSVDDAETVLDWADEVNYPGWRAKPGDVANPSNWDAAGGQPHIHIPGAGRSGHVPVQPGVRPRP